VSEKRNTSGRVVVLVEETRKNDGGTSIDVKSVWVEGEEEYAQISRLASFIVWYRRDGNPPPIQVQELKRLINSNKHPEIEATVIDLSSLNLYSSPRKPLHRTEENQGKCGACG